MVALALSEDSIKQRVRRDAIIDSLIKLPDSIREVRLPAAAAPLGPGLMCTFQSSTAAPAAMSCFRSVILVPLQALDLDFEGGVSQTPALVAWQALKLDDDMKALAKHLQHEGSLLLFGRGYNYATALEAALKVKEVALMHRWAARETRLALVPRYMPRHTHALSPPTNSLPGSSLESVHECAGDEPSNRVTTR